MYQNKMEKWKLSFEVRTNPKSVTCRTKHNDAVINTVYLCGLGDYQSWPGF